MRDALADSLGKQIPFGSAQGRRSRQEKGARNDKTKIAQYRIF
jgi:hypothetical protein